MKKKYKVTISRKKTVYEEAELEIELEIELNEKDVNFNNPKEIEDELWFKIDNNYSINDDPDLEWEEVDSEYSRGNEFVVDDFEEVKNDK